MVVLLHCVVPPSEGFVAWVVRHTFANGWIGVDIFFVLSGYLITSILLKQKSEPHYFRNFYARRALRIFPLFYLIAIALMIAAPHLPFGPFPALTILTYTSNFARVFSHDWEPLSHAWSLCVEEQFYLFYPWVVLTLDTARLRKTLWWVIALSPFIRGVTNALLFPKAAYYLTFCYLDVLGMGALVAVIFHERGEISGAAVRKLRVALGALLFTTIVLWLTKQLGSPALVASSIVVTLIGAVAAVVIALSAVDALPAGRLLRNPILVGIGRISYGIYLIHYVVLQLTLAFMRNRFGDTWTNTAVVSAVSIGATFALAVVSWLGFERPILRLKKYFYEDAGERARVRAETLDAIPPEGAS